MSKTEKGIRYPSANLKEAVKSIKIIKDALGSISFSRDAGVQALGYRSLSGASSSKLASLVHFGLLARTGETYRVSKLAERILFPISEEDKKIALVEAVRHPKLYSELIAKFENAPIPGMLSNILIVEYGISDKNAPGAAQDFQASLEYVGLLVDNKISLNSHETRSPHNEEELSPTNSIEAVSPTKQEIQSLTQQRDMFSIKLESGIIINFPQDISLRVAVGDFAQAIKLLDSVANNKERQ